MLLYFLAAITANKGMSSLVTNPIAKFLFGKKPGKKIKIKG